MAIDFPTSPTPNQLHTAGSRSWSWNNSVGAWYAVNAGVQGIQGIQGTQGVQGIQGITGLAFTIAKTYLSVAALNADTAPTAIVAGQFALINTTNVEDAENSRLYIWTGSTYTFVDDLSGSAGIQGITGSQGVQGIQGIQGTQGTQGLQGITGSQGTQGTQGTQGIQGIQGTAGFVGSNGAQGTQGQQGIQGIQGITGSQGITGAQGITGTNGTQGAQGTVGSTGSQGITGAQGTVGTTGAQGTQGTLGTQGITGTTGAQGTVGTQGAGGLTTLTATSVVATVAGTSSTELVRGNMADNDQFRILVGGTATNAGYVEIATADDGTEPIYVRQYTGVFSSLARTATLLDGSGNTSFPGTISASNFSGSHSGTSSGTNTGDQTTISGNAATVSSITSNTGLMVNRLTPTAFVDTLTTANFRSTLFGTTTNAEAIATARWNTPPAPLSGLASYGTMIAWSANDTQGFLALNYNTAGAIIGGGNGNNINWTATLLHSGNYNSYSPTLTGGSASGTWGINVTGNAANITAYTINQNVGTGNGPTFDTVYCGNWFRSSGSSGWYSSTYAVGIYATEAGWVTTYNGAGFRAAGITATGNITAYYSDERLKTRLGPIDNALSKVLSLNGFYFEANETAQALGYKKKKEVGVSAQEVELVLPEIIAPAPIDAQYKTLDYGKLVPLLIEAIKDLNAKVDSLQTQLNNK